MDNRSRQAAFAEGLRHSPPGDAVLAAVIAQGMPDAAARFAVYRNNVASAIRRGLLASFPATSRLLGEEYFGALALDYLREFPPQSPVLSEYGARFPEYLRQLRSLDEYRYVADVAELEWQRQRSFHAADAPVLTLASLQRPGLASKLASKLASNVESLLTRSFLVHPSVYLLSSEHPVLRLWQSQMDGSSPPGEDDWQAESILIWRHNFVVRQVALNLAQWVFACEMQVGTPLLAAMSAAVGEDAATSLSLTDSLSQMFLHWIDQGVFTET